MRERGGGAGEEESVEGMRVREGVESDNWEGEVRVRGYGGECVIRDRG